LAKEQTYGWRGSLIFPSSQTGTQLSNMAISQLVRGMSKDGLGADAVPRWRDIEGRPIVPHGFRTTFKDWSRARGYEDHLSEIALADVDKDKVRAAYARDDLLEQRRAMMDEWARHCTGAVATIATLAKKPKAA